MLRGSCGSSLRAHGGVPSRPKHLTKGFNSSAAVAAGSGARARLEGNTCSRRPGKSISGTKAPQTGRRAASRSASLSLTVLCSSQERSQTRHLKADTNAPHAHPRQRCGGVGACMSDPHLHLHLAPVCDAEAFPARQPELADLLRAVRHVFEQLALAFCAASNHSASPFRRRTVATRFFLFNALSISNS